MYHESSIQRVVKNCCKNSRVGWERAVRLALNVIGDAEEASRNAAQNLSFSACCIIGYKDTII